MNVTTALILVALASGGATPELTQLEDNPACQSTSAIIGYLGSSFGESWQADGRIRQGPMPIMPADESRVALFANDETGSWTMVVVYPEAGMSCLIAEGDDWNEEATAGAF